MYPISFRRCLKVYRLKLRGSEVMHNSPPQFAQSLGELSIVQVWVLVSQLPPCCLSPHHEGIHRSLDVWLPFLSTGRIPCRHRNQCPVITVQDMTDRILDLSREGLVGSLCLGCRFLSHEADFGGAKFRANWGRFVPCTGRKGHSIIRGTRVGYVRVSHYGDSND